MGVEFWVVVCLTNFTSKIKRVFYENSKMFLRDCYVSLFESCRKCGKKIDPNDGYWHWKNNPYLKGGYYHTDCGTLNNPKPTGFFPF